MDQRAEDIATSATADFKKRIEDGGEKATSANPHQLSLYDLYAPRPTPHLNTTSQASDSITKFSIAGTCIELVLQL